MQSLQGKIAGVSITQSSGQPGDGASVRLRGTTSLTGSSAPMYIVDGVILTGGLADIDALDIESIEVVKVNPESSHPMQYRRLEWTEAAHGMGFKGLDMMMYVSEAELSLPISPVELVGLEVTEFSSARLTVLSSSGQPKESIPTAPCSLIVNDIE